MEVLWKYFSLGKLSKSELEKVLREHKRACDAMDSEDRQRFVASEEAMAGKDDFLKYTYSSYYLGYISKKHLEEALGMHRSGSGETEIDSFLSRVSKK